MYLISTGKSSSTSSIEITSLFTTHDFAARIFIDTPLHVEIKYGS